MYFSEALLRWQRFVPKYSYYMHTSTTNAIKQSSIQTVCFQKVAVSFFVKSGIDPWTYLREIFVLQDEVWMDSIVRGNDSNHSMLISLNRWVLSLMSRP